MKKKGLTLVLSAALIFFYFTIIMYVFFAVLHVETLANFEIGMAFEIIGFFILAYLILGNIASKPIKTGFFVPLLMISIIYTIILDIVNITFIASMSQVWFILVNFSLLFVYALISIPMFILGKR